MLLKPNNSDFITYGDRIKDERRDKRQCLYFNNGRCSYTLSRCPGSSHCDYYSIDEKDKKEQKIPVIAPNLYLQEIIKKRRKQTKKDMKLEKRDFPKYTIRILYKNNVLANKIINKAKSFMENYVKDYINPNVCHNTKEDFEYLVKFLKIEGIIANSDVDINNKKILTCSILQCFRYEFWFNLDVFITLVNDVNTIGLSLKTIVKNKQEAKELNLAIYKTLKSIGARQLLYKKDINVDCSLLSKLIELINKIDNKEYVFDEEIAIKSIIKTIQVKENNLIEFNVEQFKSRVTSLYRQKNTIN